MSTFNIPDIPVPAPVKKPPVKLSPGQWSPDKPATASARPAKAPNKLAMQSGDMPSAAMPQTGLAGKETQVAPLGSDNSWGVNQSGPAELTAADLLAGDREIWAKGVILAMILGKPRCKNRGWR